MTSTVADQTHSLRADASRNRERILAAAREAFIEHGPDVPLDTIAHRAGLGNATLYRHFTDRHELVLLATLSSLGRIAELAETAMAEETDPFDALRRFVHEAADERVGALCTLISGVVDPTDPALKAENTRLENAINRLLDNARRTGQLRTDIAVGDLMVAITQLTRPPPGAACANFDRFVHRHLQLFVDGLSTPARSTLPGKPVTTEELRSHRT